MLLFSADREQPAGGVEQNGASRERLEPGGDPPEEAEELRGDIWGDPLEGREWRSRLGRSGVRRLFPK